MEITTHTWTQGYDLQVDTVSKLLVVSIGKEMVRHPYETTPESVYTSQLIRLHDQQVRAMINSAASCGHRYGMQLVCDYLRLIQKMDTFFIKILLQSVKCRVDLVSDYLYNCYLCTFDLNLLYEAIQHQSTAVPTVYSGNSYAQVYYYRIAFNFHEWSIF